MPLSLAKLWQKHSNFCCIVTAPYKGGQTREENHRQHDLGLPLEQRERIWFSNASFTHTLFVDMIVSEGTTYVNICNLSLSCSIYAAFLNAAQQPLQRSKWVLYWLLLKQNNTNNLGWKAVVVTKQQYDFFQQKNLEMWKALLHHKWPNHCSQDDTRQTSWKCLS